MQDHERGHVEQRQPSSLTPEYVEGRAAEALRAGRPLAPPEGATYYELPPIKKPLWKWHIPTYFWLGGMAAGSYLVALLADLAGRAEERGLVRWGRYIALVGMLVSPLLLIEDLGRRERFHHMLRIVKPRSVINLGTWLLTLFGGFAGLLGLAQALEDLLPGPRTRVLRGPARVVGLVGAPLAVLVGTYTGVLLSATSVALWAKARLHLAPMFFASALATGSAAVALAARPADCGTRQRLGQLMSAALAVELAHSLLME